MKKYFTFVNVFILFNLLSCESKGLSPEASLEQAVYSISTALNLGKHKDKVFPDSVQSIAEAGNASPEAWIEIYTKKNIKLNILYSGLYKDIPHDAVVIRTKPLEFEDGSIGYAEVFYSNQVFNYRLLTK